MRWNSTAVAMTAALFMLVGCAGLPEVPYDRSAAQVKTVGIVTPRMPSTPSVVLASSVGRSFGLIGALIDAGMQADREATFKRLVDQENFSAPQILVDSLASDLTASGYTVKLIDVPREKPDFLEAYPVAQEPAVDAYLDVATDAYGYIAAGIGASTPYRPVMWFKARLVSAKDKSVLMQNAFFYNPITRSGDSRVPGFITIPPDPGYEFRDFDTLSADPSNAVMGLGTAIRQSAHSVSTLLK